MKRRIYLDHNATTPLCRDLETDIISCLNQWGNASSIHFDGRGPKALLREARRKIAQFIGCEQLELIFTSGGSEANNLALKGIWEAQKLPFAIDPHRNEIIVSAVEHPSVMKTVEYLRARGAIVHKIPVNRKGEIDFEFYESVLSEKTLLVSVMLANNETGHIFPIHRMVKAAHAAGALFHCDAVQALGKVIVNVKAWGVDLASFSGHKFYSLKGCGMLYVRKGLRLESLIHGGGQERGRRAGTENVLAIASLGFMTEKIVDLPEKIQQMTLLRDYFETKVQTLLEDVVVNGPDRSRLCNTSSLVIKGIDGETLLMNLDMKGFAVSTGAACSSGSPEPSPVLLAMGLTREEAQSSLRFSLGIETTQDDIDRFLEALREVVVRLRTFKHGERSYYDL